MSSPNRPGNRQTLSVCLIARDEARHLPGCLESVRDWADEIVLVDTGSTDGTPDIARRVGARVVGVTWDGDFSKARNVALEHATGDWILSIDADERLDYVNGARLLRLIGEAPPAIDALQLRIVSAADSTTSGVELVHFYPRLFRRHPLIRFRGALHEQLYKGEFPLGLAAPKTPLSLYHLGYADPDKNRVRLRRNHDIAVAEAAVTPADPTARLKLADTHVMVGELDQAEALYAGLLEEQSLGELKANVRWNLAVCRFRAGDVAGAMAQLDRAVEEFPGLTGTRFMQAQLLMEAGRHAEAIPHLDALLTPSRHDPLMTDIRPQPAFVLTLKGLCLAVDGEVGEAEALFDQALARDPQLFAAHCHRADLMLSLGRPAEALTGYLRAAALRPDHGTVRLRAGIILLDQGRREDGIALIREAARLDPVAAPRALEVLAALEREARGEPLVAPAETAAAPAPDAARLPDSLPPPPFLSVCLIVRDEAARLPDCLASVRGVAGEIVVCDTGSVDGTPGVARSLGATVVEFPWCDDFAAARNAALDAARGEWVLILDADERLTAGSARDLPDLLRSDRADGYNVTIESPLRGEVVNRFTGNYCRLFRRLPGVRFEGRVHEQIYPSLRRLGRRIIPSSLVIEHLGYALDPEAMEAKKRRNLALLERELADKPEDHFVQFNLGVAHFSLHDHERALSPLRAAVRQAGEPLPPEILAVAYTRLAQCALGEGDLPQAARDARSALTVDPGAAVPRFVLATIACQGERFDEAAAEFGRILSAGQPGAGDGIDRAEVAREMGVCLYRAGRWAEAADALAGAVKDRPADALGRLLLGNALARAGRHEAALDAWRGALAIDPELSEARANLEAVAVEVGYRHFDAGRHAAALATVPAGTRNTELLFLAAISRHALGDLPGARESLETLNARDDTFAEAHWNLALVCRAQGDVAAARAALGRFRQLAPGDPRSRALEEALAQTS